MLAGSPEGVYLGRDGGPQSSSARRTSSRAGSRRSVDTPLGLFPLAGQNGGTAVEVLVRPELLALALDHRGAGR